MLARSAWAASLVAHWKQPAVPAGTSPYHKCMQCDAVRKKLQLAGRVVSDQRRQEQRLGTTVAELGSSGVQLLPGAPGLTWQEREGGQQQGRRHGLFGGPQLHLPIQR